MENSVGKSKDCGNVTMIRDNQLAF
jgi:hypothetical protein